MSNVTIIKELVETASKFTSSIVLQIDQKYIDVKSILGLFTALLPDEVYSLHIHGADETEAKKELQKVFEKHQLKFEMKE